MAWRERLVGNARVVLFLLGLVLAWLAFFGRVLSPWWLLLPATVFTYVLFWHESVVRAWHRASRAVGFYQRGLARLDNNWKGQGQPGDRFLSDEHPYAADLDLFGAGSLFELLCTARTRTGEDTLASWLRGPAQPGEIRARQAAVAELRPMLDLREDLALLGDAVPVGVDFDAVIRWGGLEPILVEQWPRWAALVLGVLALPCLLGWLLADWGSLPFMAVVLLELGLMAHLRTRLDQVLQTVEKRSRDLALLANVLARLEKASFTSPRLRELHAALEGNPAPPSQRIAALGNLIDLFNSRRNILFAPVAYLVLWSTHMAYAIESWRAVSGKAIARWLEIIGQLEALCALATYASENPEDPFPEIVTEHVCFEGEGLGHPLLPMPRERRVRNDLKLGEGLRVLVVSGSNMSGKSTFLRTVGINAVLALAGAPVMARRLRLSPLAIGATLRIQDSLQQGKSRFYAELLRVRQVVELSRGPLPLLFLLDEIFAGTNSHDRRLGAEAVVTGLVKAGAIGLVTTHDLSLTHIADNLGEKGANVHFADQFLNGVMTFDFRLQPGVVRNSNALALMRAVGLEV